MYHEDVFPLYLHGRNTTLQPPWNGIKNVRKVIKLCHRMSIDVCISVVTKAPLFSSLQLATRKSCNKHSNWTVLSQCLHSKTQSWTLLLTVEAALSESLLSLPSCSLCCCLCPIMFVPCFVLLPCCCHVLLLLSRPDHREPLFSMVE